jgi:hypothetical protein
MAQPCGLACTHIPFQGIHLLVFRGHFGNSLLPHPLGLSILLFPLSLLRLYSKCHTYDLSPFLTSFGTQLALFRSQLRYHFLCSHWLCQNPFTDNGHSSTGSLMVPLRIWLACIRPECPQYAPFALLATCFCPISCLPHSSAMKMDEIHCSKTPGSP